MTSMAHTPRRQGKSTLARLVIENRGRANTVISLYVPYRRETDLPAAIEGPWLDLLTFPIEPPQFADAAPKAELELLKATLLLVLLRKERARLGPTERSRRELIDKCIAGERANVDCLHDWLTFIERWRHRWPLSPKGAAHA